MKVIFFANRMPDLCGAFLHDIDLGIELQKRGHQVVFLTIKVPKEGYQGGTYRSFRFMHYSAGSQFLDSSDIWLCPHAPVLPDVRRLNMKGYHRPIIATCHYDGNYLSISKNASPRWVEMLLFINKTMEPNYKKVVPQSIVRTEVIRPIMHREKIVIPDEFEGEYITLVNANQNKGVNQFIEIAKRMPERKFLGVLPYYGELQVPLAPPNVTWVPFDDDIRNILRKTRILLMPSYYESFGRIAIEAMINGIPVLYSKPIVPSQYPGGSTEGVQEWIGNVGIACSRDSPEEWMSAIESLDSPESYEERSAQSKQHIDSLDLFSEAPKIASVVEDFSRQYPAKKIVQQVQQQQAQTPSQSVAPRLKEPMGPVGFGFSNGRLRIQR